MEYTVSHQLTMARTAATPPTLAYREGSAWREEAYAKLQELLGMPTEGCEDQFAITDTRCHEAFTEILFRFQSEPGYFIPCHLLVPKGAEGPRPVMLCLQGHSKGMHVSMGIQKYESENMEEIIPRSFALQAVEHGFCAITMDQRYMGAAGRDANGKPACLGAFPALAATLWGRTAIGERVFDVSRLIDVVENHLTAYIRSDRIFCMGTSGGGTATTYAAAMDHRIRGAILSCALCTYETSIMAMYHCPCNYIPGIRKFFEMGDVAALIAPRPLVVYSGAADNIFPLAGSKTAFATVRQAFSDAGCADRCAHVVGPGGHGFAPELVWPEFIKRTEDL
jgi:hypothetical protein